MTYTIRSLLVFSALSAAACGASVDEDDSLLTEVQALAAAEHCPRIEKLAPGVLSTERDEGRIVFTPDGTTAYFHVPDENFIYSIMESHRVHGVWTTPVVASFSGHDDMDPFVTDDGKYLWFSSWRGVDGAAARPDTDLWRVKRQGNAWSEPEHMAISSDYYENFASLGPDGTLYFNTNRAAASPTDFDGWDIYAAKRAGAGYAPAERLGPGVNTVENWEFNPALLAGGRLLIFSSIRDSGFGGADLYASVRVGKTWLPAVNLGACVNTEAGEFHPSYSAARQRLTFVRFSEATAGDFFEFPLGW